MLLLNACGLGSNLLSIGNAWVWFRSRYVFLTYACGLGTVLGF